MVATSARHRAPLTYFHGMVSVAPAMKELFELVGKVARTDASVLIRGETGTGKELIARALHDLSPRAEAPFRAINCATLTSELLASELFGHVRGAFTGAVQDRRGLFSLADRGSLFLDEVAEIDPDIQARLLRVLQEKTFVPVGGTEPLHADVRILAATHRSLRREVEAGRFRGDLMYRVRVVPIYVPPLRARVGDVEALTWYFIDQFNRKGQRRVGEIDAAALEALLAHPFPGNVRELRNAVEYAFAVGEGHVLRIDELPPELRGEPPPGGEEPADLRELERRRIVQALSRTGGRRAEAAAELGISRSTLWRKMRELGVRV